MARGLAMIHVHTYYDMVIEMVKAVDIFAQLHARKLELKTCFSSTCTFVTLKYIDYIVLGIVCIEVDGMCLGLLQASRTRILIMVHFRIKLTPHSQFAGYSPDYGHPLLPCWFFNPFLALP